LQKVVTQRKLFVNRGREFERIQLSEKRKRKLDEQAAAPNDLLQRDNIFFISASQIDSGSGSEGVPAAFWVSHPKKQERILETSIKAAPNPSVL